jgi:hypothetical protein
MNVLIQLPTDPRDRSAAARQRRQFHEYVTTKGRPGLDRVIVVEPNPNLCADLKKLWADWPGAEVRCVAVTTDIESAAPEARTTVNYYRAKEDLPDYASMGADENAVRRRYPNGTIEMVSVPATDLEGLLAEGAGAERIALLVIDGSSGLFTQAGARTKFESVDAVAINTNALVTAGDLEVLVIGLVSTGFMRAGRPWGEAGESALFVKAHSTVERARATTSEAKVRAGRVLVAARDDWFGPARRQLVLTKLRASVQPELTAVDILDPTAGHSLQPILPAEVEQSLRRVEAGPTGVWRAAEPFSADPWLVASQCHAKHGVWPISFSYPKVPMQLQAEPAHLVGLITPGFPYSFESEREYLDSYAEGYWGITHRKAGWDCFRHVEILASGALPWMLDASDIPGFSMVHYPKAALAEAARALSHGGCTPDDSTRLAFREHFLRHLTSEAMARYLLRAAGIEESRSVLFVDERLPHHADYQSVLTLIGLKQVLGSNCHVLHPVDYIFDDTKLNTSSLYGRGFGYTRAVSGSARAAGEISGVSAPLKTVDAVIVGSITRNRDLATKLLDQFSPDRTIWIHGEDLPPTMDEVSHYRRSKVHMFVRAIHVDR